MDNLNDLKKIWLTAKTDGLPDVTEIRLIIKKYRNRRLIEKLAMILTACFFSALMIAVIFLYKPRLLSTSVGEALILLAYGILLINNIKSFRRMIRLRDCTNKEFITHLEQASIGRIYFYKKTQVFCLAISSAGLLLYLFELVYNDKGLCAIVYTVTLIWLAIMWLVIRPRVFKRKQDKINTTLRKMEILSKQL